VKIERQPRKDRCGRRGDSHGLTQAHRELLLERRSDQIRRQHYAREYVCPGRQRDQYDQGYEKLAPHNAVVYLLLRFCEAFG
jgi:hypothetical protein